MSWNADPRQAPKDGTWVLWRWKLEGGEWHYFVGRYKPTQSDNKWTNGSTCIFTEIGAKEWRLADI